MKNIINGDQESFNVLYDRYKNKLFYYFYRMLGNCSNTANDFLQDLFLKIIDRPDLYNPSYPFHTWIYSVAHNLCKNEYRKREVRKNYAESETGSEPIHEPDFHYFEKTDPLDLAFQKIEELSENSRDVLLLKYKENFSIEEISEILDLPSGTVKSRLYYARVELTKVLKGLEIYER